MKGTRYIVCRTGEKPVTISPGVIYDCVSEGSIWLLCPCGCGEAIGLNTIQGVRPCWKLTGTTISPSINRQVGCRSHFSIKDGVVV